eukprot:SAG31_NODE_10804_length_1095_cov_1.444779_1_plen_281_part_00
MRCRSTHHPLVRVRCGAKTLNDVGSTLPLIGGGRSPTWSQKHRHEVSVKRHLDDEGMLVVEVWDHDDRRNGRDTFVGGNYLPVQKYMDSPLTEFDESVTLHANGLPPGTQSPTSEAGGAEVGQLRLAIKWAPAELSSTPHNTSSETTEGAAVPRGDLQVTAKDASELQFPERMVRDLSNYMDVWPPVVALAVLLAHLLGSMLFYLVYMAPSEATQTNHSDLLSRIHKGNGEWSLLNVMVFLLTSFTTVGYGNHVRDTMLVQTTYARTQQLCTALAPMRRS